MRYEFNNPKVSKPARPAVFDEYVERAKACLYWNMSPEYYDSLSDLEFEAWIKAWNQIQKEKGGK